MGLEKGKVLGFYKKEIRKVNTHLHMSQKERLKAGGSVLEPIVESAVKSAKDGMIAECALEKDNGLSNCGSPSFFISASGRIKIPALVDLHVHFREPGNPEKETILTGMQSAQAGGYGLVCTMPNLNPAPDCFDNLQKQLNIVKEQESSVNGVTVLPYGCLTIGRKGKEPAKFDEMMPYVAGFSDDGSGIEDDEVMEECMKRIAKLGGLVVAHCEKREAGSGKCEVESEWEAVRRAEWTEVERNIRLAKATGCRLHLCHISTKESIDIIRKAKSEGVNVSCETAPHYLLFEDTEEQALRNSEGGRFKMNPPIGTSADRKALVEALKDGTIDVIATDHAPHTVEDKKKGANGIVGLESAFPVMYTNFVRNGIISLERLVELMSLNGVKILQWSTANGQQSTEVRPMMEFDVETPFVIDSSKFKSKGRSCPFDGMEVYGRLVASGK